MNILEQIFPDLLVIVIIGFAVRLSYLAGKKKGEEIAEIKYENNQYAKEIWEEQNKD